MCFYYNVSKPVKISEQKINLKATHVVQPVTIKDSIVALLHRTILLRVDKAWVVHRKNTAYSFIKQIEVVAKAP